MFIILLISSALGACADIQVEKDCWADINCQWDDSSSKCLVHRCDGLPMKGMCEIEEHCEWKDGKCFTIDCRRYPAEKCPTDDNKCKVFTDAKGTSHCYPENSDPKADDVCTQALTLYTCIAYDVCAWAKSTCKYDGCSREEPTADKCKESDGCKIIEAAEEEKDDYCAPKVYDPEDPYCCKLTKGAECNVMMECITLDGKCKFDECMKFGAKITCEAKSGCTWGVPEVLKDYLGENDICYNKNQGSEDSALSVMPALVQNKIFQLASALLLFWLI